MCIRDRNNMAYDKFQILKSTAVPLQIENVDTDQIIPARFLKATERKGFGDNLFRDWRYNSDDSVKKDFVLNNVNFNGKILVGGKNFGSGSSREHAVRALRDFGIKAVIASSFGDIFYNNSFKNGLLPIKLDKTEIDFLFKQTHQDILELSINLQKKEIKVGEKIIFFSVEQHLVDRIIYGLDDIDITLKEKNKILNFEKARAIEKPWVFK